MTQRSDDVALVGSVADPDPYVFGPPDPDPLVRGTDPAPDPSRKNWKKKLDS